MPRPADLQMLDACFGESCDAVASFDRDARCVYANRSAHRLGFVEARPLAELDVSPELASALARMSKRALEHAECGAAELACERTGSRYEHRVTPRRDAEGRVVGATLVAREVRARTAVSSFPAIARRAPVLLWLADANNDGTWYNDTWLAFRGRTLEQEAGTGWLEGVHPGDRERAADICGSAFTARRPFSLELRLRGADGEYRWMLDSGVPLYDDDGTFTGYVGACTDITARKADEEAKALLFASERSARVGAQQEHERRLVTEQIARAQAELERARFHRLLLHAPALVAILRGPDHVYEFLNERFCETIPDARKLVGTSARAHRHDPVEEHFLELLDRVYETGEPYEAVEVPLTVERATGPEALYLTFVYQPIRSSDGAVEGIASFAFDVTESVLARKQVEEASRAKDDFLSTLSHELRTPLNAIVGWSHLLRTGALEASQSSRALEAIERNAKVQKRLIDDLLDFARMVSGKLGLQLAWVDLASVVGNAIESVRPSLDAKEVSLSIDIADRPRLRGDADRLQQVAWNLLSNAVKFTGPRGRVRVSVREMAGVAEMSIEDDGLGIDPAFLPFVFERFRQADSTTTRRHGGLGLGLAIARSIVEMHGGSIHAESEGLGRGARMRVRLPARVASDSPSSETRQAVLVDGLALRGLRVLVVDDEEDARRLSAAILVSAGAEVRQVASALEALDALHAAEHDALVSDVGMPEHDGLTLIRRVRALPGPASRIPAIAVTAYARGEDRDRAVGAGFDAFLSKPIDARELTTLVARVVGLVEP